MNECDLIKGGNTFGSVAKCRGSWVVGRGRGSWVWVMGVGVGKCRRLKKYRKNKKVKRNEKKK